MALWIPQRKLRLLSERRLRFPFVQDPQPPSGPARFIMPVAQGSGDGSSWANAGSLSSLSAFVTQLANIAASNRIVYIRADAGPHASVSQTITAGGSAVNALIVESTLSENGRPYWIRNPSLNWNPITIRGVNVNLTPTPATIVGTRTLWTRPADISDPSDPVYPGPPVTSVSGWSIGGDCIHLAAGANNLVFEYLDFQRTGERAAIFVNAGVTVSNIEIGHCTGYNVRRFYDQDAGGTTILSQAHFHHITVVGHSKHCFRPQGGSNFLLFENLDIDSGRQNNDSFGVCLGIDGQAHHITVRNCNFRYCYASNTSYWNGDGMSSEVPNHDIQVIDVDTTGHTDAGFDFKSTNTSLTRCIGRDSKRHFRVWQLQSSTRWMDSCSSYDIHQRGGTGGRCGIWIEGDTNPASLGWGPLICTNFTWHESAGMGSFSAMNSIEYYGANIHHHNARVTDDAGHTQTLNGSGNVPLTVTSGVSVTFGNGAGGNAIIDFVP